MTKKNPTAIKLGRGGGKAFMALPLRFFFIFGGFPHKIKNIVSEGILSQLGLTCSNMA